MLRIALASVRRHQGRFIASFVALAFASAMVVACGVLITTGSQGAVAPTSYSRADVIVAGDQHAERFGRDISDERRSLFPERIPVGAALAETIRGVSGVAAVVPESGFPATLVAKGGPVAEVPGTLGRNWSSAQLGSETLSSGRAPARPDEIAIPVALAEHAGLAVGSSATVDIRGTIAEYRVVGLVSRDEPAGTSDEQPPIPVFTTDEFANDHVPVPGTVSAFGVFAAAGVDAAQLRRDVQRAVDQAIGVAPPSGRPVALAGNDRTMAERPGYTGGSGDLAGVATVFGGLAVLIAPFVVSSTFALSVQSRRREIALLRAIGTTPRQIRLMVAAEAAAVSLLAAVAGIWPGYLLAHGLSRLFAGMGLVPTRISVVADWGPTVGVAIVACLVTALVSSLFAAHAAAKTSPVEALGDVEVPRRLIGAARLAIGVAFLGAGTVLLGASLSLQGESAAGLAAPTVVIWVVGLSLLSPLLVRLGLTITGWVVGGLSPVTGYLATAYSRVNAARVGATVAPLILAVGFASTMIFIQTTQIAADEQEFVRDLRSDAVVMSSTGGVPSAAVEAARQVPGVAEATPMVTSRAFFTSNLYGDLGAGTVGIDGWQDNGWLAGEERVQGTVLRGVPAGQFDAIGNLVVTEGELAALTGNAVALSTQFAAEIKARAGQTITLQLGDARPVELRVAAIYDGGFAAPGATVPLDLALEHTGSGLPSEVLVRYTGGADAGAVTEALAGRLSSRPGVRVAGQDALLAGFGQEQQQNAALNYVVAGILIGYTAIAVVNTLVMATNARRKEFAVLRLSGTTGEQVLRMVGWETGFVVLAGVLLGTAAAATTLVPLSRAMLGTPMPVVDWGVYGAIVGAVALLAAAGALVPARRALRTPAVEAIDITE
ncbi:ABC transporter permease [Amycolatopsis sp.]|uniref:ABC transporter permease n=1 Tax=Amycolatopsis sp. TaxID=37632 RepID=UPI002D7E7DEE|nr:FtsX-like permease family protein [Amycolatopsis sp.]HET6708334.1 FtsX-like permease family protein [Amycolatopsis sp.]